MNILIIGYFGYEDNQIDGQTIRTRSIYSLFKKHSDYEVEFFDTQTLKKSKLNAFKLIHLIQKSDSVINIAAHRNLKYLFPVTYLIAKLANTKLNYVAVGGWLFDYLRDKPLHKYILCHTNHVFVQTENLHQGLKNIGFENVSVLNNFRLVDYSVLPTNLVSNLPLKLVYMARVHPLKGVDVLFKLEKKLKEQGILDFQIDVFGPIFSPYEAEFKNKLTNSGINYLGVLDPDEIVNTLPQYDLMLFPTKYYTEGFPGTILDSYICGLPVIASKWLNAEEFIDHEKTGYIVEFGNDEEFIRRTIYLLLNPKKLNDLKQYVVHKRYLYSEELAWKTLKKIV